MITLLIISLCVTVQTPFRMAISARLTIELCLVQVEKSSSESRLVNDLFRNFPIAFSKANLTQISATVNLVILRSSLTEENQRSIADQIQPYSH